MGASFVLSLRRGGCSGGGGGGGVVLEANILAQLAAEPSEQTKIFVALVCWTQSEATKFGGAALVWWRISWERHNFSQTEAAYRGRPLAVWVAGRERERAQMSLDALAYWRARFNASDSIYDQSAPPAIGQRRPILRLVLNKPGLTFWPPDMEQFSFWLSANPLPSCKQC